MKLGEDMQSTTVAFEPNVYNGTGDELRKRILFKICKDDCDAIHTLETWCRDQLRATYPTVDTL